MFISNHGGAGSWPSSKTSNSSSSSSSITTLHSQVVSLSAKVFLCSFYHSAMALITVDPEVSWDTSRLGSRCFINHGLLPCVPPLFFSRAALVVAGVDGGG